MKSCSEAQGQLQREENQRFSGTEPPAHLSTMSFHQVLRLVSISCNSLIPLLSPPRDGWGSGSELPW